MSLRTILICLPFALTTACGDDTKPAVEADTTSAADTFETPDAIEETTPVEETVTPVEVVVPAECDHEPACQDQQVSKLAFKGTISTRTITEESAPTGTFFSHVDATAGGFSGTEGFVYAKFTSEGLSTVAISDEDSLESADWDIAFRRFVVRLNSGVSGPGCVIAATLPDGTEFGGLHAAPDNVPYHAEAYFKGANCTFVDDGTGIDGPGSVLSSYWNYISCVAMSGNVYVLRLSDGHHVKLKVESYYDPAVQAQCDEGQELSSSASAGNFRVRWAFLD